MSLIKIKPCTLDMHAACAVHTSFHMSLLEMHGTAHCMMPSSNGHASPPANESCMPTLRAGTCLCSTLARLHPCCAPKVKFTCLVLLNLEKKTIEAMNQKSMVGEIDSMRLPVEGQTSPTIAVSTGGPCLESNASCSPVTFLTAQSKSEISVTGVSC